MGVNCSSKETQEENNYPSLTRDIYSHDDILNHLSENNIDKQ